MPTIEEMRERLRSGEPPVAPTRDETPGETAEDLKSAFDFEMETLEDEEETILDATTLVYKKGVSNKVYIVQVVMKKFGGDKQTEYIVQARFGRRDATGRLLRTHIHVTTSIRFDAFNKAAAIVKKKKAKDYHQVPNSMLDC